MTGCENLCTAAKCAELEARIDALEQLLNQHLSQAIPVAHDYDSNLQIKAFLTGKQLGISISDVTSNDTADVNIPFCDESTCSELEEKIDNHLSQSIPTAHDYECDLSVEAFYDSGGLGISVSSCFGSDTANAELPFCTTEECGQVINEITNITNEITNINNTFNNTTGSPVFMVINFTYLNKWSEAKLI